MPIGEPIVLQVKVDGINIKSLLDDKFIAKMKKEFTDFRFQHLCLYIGKGKEEEEFVTLAHTSPEDEESDTMMIDTDKSETLQKLLDVLKKIDEGE